ncbi:MULTISPECIES: universal stress protein [Empedobacter]|uniref:Universal stress protein n=1 Tax=Empedobacter falsenii TaxID=343874 RepID=A0A427BNR5_9FLAO|nr:MULTISPECIES: universal stress protein [Empedobacter]MBY0066117.1 universal stress protein [Empedobacter falsenii]MDH0658652.1 universal stress protein [Empedobacter sp. GD03865]RRT91347.1 universal stress protein [Empedobacter falsenii]RRT91406.1 universal stress protein [Empedobacter falsenii]
MKKILFPTDFSETANNAFLYALNLAKSIDAQVYVLHVYELPMITGSLSAGLIQNVYETVELGSFDNFKDNIPQLRQIAVENDLNEIPIKFILEEGNFLYILREIIGEESVDFVVMGTDGNSGIEKMLFGSNTINAITSMKVPILSIPHGMSFKGFKNIGFTTVFDQKDKDALKYLIEIANRHHAKIHCMHVSKDGKFNEQAMKDWQDQFAGDPIVFEVYHDADPVNAVLDFIKEKQIDLLTVVSRNKGFFDKIFSPGFTKKIANKNITPLFVFHEQKV